MRALSSFLDTATRLRKFNSMPNLPRHLITTADEQTWVFDRPVLFLGDWCRIYDRRAVWELMEGVVADPYGVQPGQREKDNAYAQRLSEKLLVELSSALNVLHNTNHSDRYWNILIGYWLQRYVKMCCNRYFTIEKALSILAEREDYENLTHLNSVKKKDDIADCILMNIAYTFMHLL